MPRATHPVSINGVEFDALIDSSEALEAEAPVYPIETGYEVSDTIIIKQKALSMTLFLTETPVTWRRRNGGYGHVSQVERRLKDLYYKKQLVTVSTSEHTYTDMAITSIEFAKSAEVGYAREIPIEFVQISKTSSATTTIPDYYGKSGETGTTAGTASTSGGYDSNSSILKSLRDNGVGGLGGGIGDMINGAIGAFTG